MIRSVILAALLLGTAAAPALADPSGFVSIGAGAASFDNEYDSYDGSAIEFAASGAYDFEGGFGTQGDFVFRRYAVDVGGSDSTLGEFDGALHLFFRNDQFLIGGFVQGGRSTYEYESLYDYTINRGYAGLEGQAYLDNLTLYGRVATGRAGYADEEEDDWSSWLADIELRYFITDNFRVDAHAGTQVDQGDFKGGDITNLKLGIGAEYKLDDSPISLFGSLDYVSTKNDYSTYQTGLRVLVGAKFNFGDETLKARDRSGATLKPIEPAPGVIAPVF